ncbi:Uncharacterised protein [Mycobacteroides abscessus subsp. massiliense]|nr:Uncharacterised protein [Mycobacteroides abscessus subsp. massiliense]
MISGPVAMACPGEDPLGHLKHSASYGKGLSVPCGDSAAAVVAAGGGTRVTPAAGITSDFSSEPLNA